MMASGMARYREVKRKRCVGDLRREVPGAGELGGGLNDVHDGFFRVVAITGLAWCQQDSWTAVG